MKEKDKDLEGMKVIETKSWTKEQLTLLLQAFGYDSDGEFVLKDGKKHLDKYTGEEIKIRQMAVLPYHGSVLVMDGVNPFSIISYLSELEEG